MHFSRPLTSFLFQRQAATIHSHHQPEKPCSGWIRWFQQVGGRLGSALAPWGCVENQWAYSYSTYGVIAREATEHIHGILFGRHCTVQLYLGPLSNYSRCCALGGDQLVCKEDNSPPYPCTIRSTSTAICAWPGGILWIRLESVAMEIILLDLLVRRLMVHEILEGYLQ